FGAWHSAAHARRTRTVVHPHRAAGGSCAGTACRKVALVTAREGGAVAVMNPSLREMRDALSVGRVREPLQQAGAALYQLSHGAGVDRLLRTKRLRSNACRGGGKAQPGFAVHASSLLREPVPVLCVQRGHPKGQESCTAVSGGLEKRDRPHQP